ncbi:MAG TPA: TolC family outer membrane protein, partial [Nevskiaceae bacterium]
LILRVAQAYFGVLMAQDNVELAARQQAAIAQQLASAKARFEAGKTNVTDVRDAEARDEEVRAQSVAAANNLSIQQAQFQSVVGMAPMSLAGVSESFSPSLPEPDDLSTWRGWGRQENLNVRAARVQVEINKHEIDKYRLRSRPQLSLVAGYADKRQNGTLPVLVNPDVFQQTTVGVQLSVPLFTGGSYTSKYREAVAEANQAKYQLEATLENTDVQIKQQFLNVSVGTRQITALQAAVVAAKSSLDATELGLQVGKRTTLDVLNAQQQCFASLQNLDGARYQYLVARLNLAALVNRLDDADVMLVNASLDDSAPRRNEMP